MQGASYTVDHQHPWKNGRVVRGIGNSQPRHQGGTTHMQTTLTAIQLFEMRLYCLLAPIFVFSQWHWRGGGTWMASTEHLLLLPMHDYIAPMNMFSLYIYMARKF